MEEKIIKYQRIHQNDAAVGSNQRRTTATDRAICGAGAATPFLSREFEVERPRGPASAAGSGGGRGARRPPSAFPRAPPERPLPPPAAAGRAGRADLSSRSNERRLNRLRSIAQSD